jgi:hypothetical protein
LHIPADSVDEASSSLAQVGPAPPIIVATDANGGIDLLQIPGSLGLHGADEDKREVVGFDAFDALSIERGIIEDTSIATEGEGAVGYTVGTVGGGFLEYTEAGVIF